MNEDDLISDYIISECEFEKAKNEYNKPSFKNKINDILEPVCVNCGSIENLSYHHIVPLSLDGTNNISNIVRLCPICHDKAHIGYGDIKKIGIFKAIQKNSLGRKRLVELNEDTIPILHRYFDCEIGANETRLLLGMSQNNRSTWERIKKEYREMFNVPDTFKNKIDLLNSQKQRIKTLSITANKELIKYNSNIEEVLHRYFNCEIGMKEAKNIIGINLKTQNAWYNLTSIYKEKFNISNEFKNLVDLENIQEQRIKTTQKNILKKKKKDFNDI